MAVITPNLQGDYHFFDSGYRGSDTAAIVFTAPPPPSTTRRYPSCFEDHLGRLHAVHAKNGIVYRRSDFSTPPFAITTQVTTNAGDIEPVCAVGPDLRAHVLWNTGSNVVYSYSDDDGRTFSPPITMIPGGKHPGIAVRADGTLIFAGLILTGSGRAMEIKRAWPGQAAADAEVVSPHLYPKAVATSFQSEWTDDSFGIAFAHDGQMTLLIHALVNVSVGGAAESETSVWASWDEMFTGIRVG